MSKDDDDEDNGIKVILIGDSGVGKTNLINTCAGLEFVEGKNPTISGSFIEKIIEINNEKYEVNLWDTAGQEAYRGVTKLFFRGSNIVLLVYDITSTLTFKSLEEWAKTCKELITEKFIFGVVGNKNDLYLDKKVTEEEAKAFAETINSKFKLVSAKTDPQAFTDFITELVIDFININKKGKKQEKKNIKLDNNNIDNNHNKHRCFGWFSQLFKKKNEAK